MQNPIVGAAFGAFKNVHDDLNFYLTIGFAAYYVIGYVLVCSFDMPAHNCLIIGSSCLLLGTAITFFEIMIANSKEAAGFFMQYYQVAILLQSSGTVLIMKALQGRKLVRWLARMSPLTFGIYIIHPMIIETLQKIGITSLSFNPLISVPLLSLTIFLAAGVVVFFLLKMPTKKLLTTSDGF